MSVAILCLNAGSSSLKFAIFDADGGATALVRGEVENLDAISRLKAKDANGATLIDLILPTGSDPVLHALLGFTDTHLGSEGLLAVGHRIVHGGADHIDPELVTTDMLEQLEALAPLDPLHMPESLAPIHAVASARPRLPQVACFDTAFHHTMPDVAKRLALPRAISDAGVRRYGFHGLSYEYIARHLAARAPGLAAGRVIVAHLGSGASLCAMKDGKSIETTMSFSPLDGLVMATRCGSLDPGVILYLARQGHDFADIENMLYFRSGLLGISGVSGDVRALLASADLHAQEALDLFAYRIAAHTGALVSALGGLDGLVFTAGIGENSPAIRSAVCARLEWLGICLNETGNLANLERIGVPGAVVDVRVIATDEESMIAHHTLATIRNGQLGVV